MRRIVGLVLLGLAAFLLTMGALVKWYAYPRLAVVPLDQDSVSTSVGENMTYFDTGTLSEQTDTLTSTLRTIGDVKASDTVLRVGDLELDRLTRNARRGGREIELQPREYQLLEYLMLHAGQVVTRTMLLEGVWEYHFDPQTNVIDVHISRLRAKIDKGEERALLHTVRGAGYCLRDAGGAVESG